MNTKRLGERKNCNLPGSSNYEYVFTPIKSLLFQVIEVKAHFYMMYVVGVKVMLPVLTEKDIHDLKDFACKHNVDYVAASFVQVSFVKYYNIMHFLFFISRS